MKKKINKPIILFDGVCNLCNKSVQLIIKHDRNNKFKFASLQSDVAKEILLQFGEINSDLNSIILINSGKIYTKSLAIIRVSKLLGGFYYFITFFGVIPKPIRDWIYDFVAKNRYQWFGKRVNCMIPSNISKDRFLR